MSESRAKGADDDRSDADRRALARERYQSVLETVRRQTSPMQPPGVAEHTLVLHLCGYGRYEPEKGRASIRTAREWGDLFAWRDTAGETRYTRTEPDALRRLNIYVHETDGLGDDLQNRVKAAIREVTDR